jgi:hypothetical protein
MLFKMLKLAGLDVPAQIAVARTEIELRAKEAADYARRATVTAALVAAFAAFFAFLFVVAAGVGLFALYSVIAEHFGVYAGLGTVAGLLIIAASVLLFAAIAKAKALSNLRIVRQPSLVRSPGSESSAPHVAPTPTMPAVGAFATTESSADLFEPLAFAFAKYVRFPTFRNPILDQFVEGLKVSAQGTADDALHGASNLIRYGSRSQLLAMIGGAAALGWLLARQNSGALRDITHSGGGPS